MIFTNIVIRPLDLISPKLVERRQLTREGLTPFPHLVLGHLSMGGQIRSGYKRAAAAWDLFSFPGA